MRRKILADSSDFNHDGIADQLLIGTDPAIPGRYSLWGSQKGEHPTLGAFQTDTLIGWIGDNMSMDVSAIGQRTVGDYDGDGVRDDFVLRDQNTGHLYIYSIEPVGYGEGFTGLETGYAAKVTDLGATGLDWKIAGVGDFTRDGSTDLITRRLVGDTFEYVLYDIERGQVTDAHALGAIGKEWKMEQPFDHDGDGTTDLAFFNENTGQHAIYHMQDSHMRDYLVY
jgi:hypothetical protein